jgi:hypothetical protein
MRLGLNIVSYWVSISGVLLRLKNGKTGAVVVVLLFFCAAGIERFQPVGISPAPQYIRGRGKKK